MGSENSSRSAPSGHDAHAPAKPATVLVADDSPVARYTLTRRLRAEGFAVIEQENATVPAANVVTQLACALLDIDLGRGEDGRELAKGLRAVREGLPIGFFTGSSDPAVVEGAREMGPVFAKPEELERAMEWVRERVG